MEMIDYDNRVFRGVENYHDGDLNSETRFFYFQEGDTVWGKVVGGGVRFGTLVAEVQADQTLRMFWQFLNMQGEFVWGTCTSTPELLPDGRLRLHERWDVLSEPGVSGESLIEELAQ